MESKTVIEVVEKLIGSIQPVGDASRDPQRLKNINILCEVAESLVGDIHDIAIDHEYTSLGSVKPIAERAMRFMTDNRVSKSYDKQDLVDELSHHISTIKTGTDCSDITESIIKFLTENRYLNI